MRTCSELTGEERTEMIVRDNSTEGKGWGGVGGEGGGRGGKGAGG